MDAPGSPHRIRENFVTRIGRGAGPPQGETPAEADRVPGKKKKKCF